MTRALAGATAVVTGASRGIGRAIAVALGRRGAFIIGTATSTTGTGAFETALGQAGLRGHGMVLDLADTASIQNFAAALAEAGGPPQILVNNAGITRDNLVIRMKDDEWNDVINTDLTSVFRMTKLCLRSMVKARYGRIINLTSVVALSGNPGQANYAAAKAGIIGFTKSLAREVGSRGVTVNAVAPGFIETDMTAAVTDAQRAQMLQHITLGRLGSADEVAEVVAFLASPSAAYITGETVNVNGGMYMA